MVLEFWYIKDVSNSDSDYGFDSTLDSYDDSDLVLYYLCLSFEELILEVVVVVFEP